MNPATFAGLLLAGWIAQQPTATTAAAQSTTPAPSQTAQEKPLSTNLKVRIATSSYLDDGRVVSASTSDWPLALNKPVVAFATSGKTMCDSRAATSDEPSEYASGWRVEFTPVKDTPGELVLQVSWSPLATNARFARVAARPIPATPPGQFGASGTGRTLTLHPGDRVVVDYISTSNAHTNFWVLRPDSTVGAGTAAKDFKLRAYGQAVASAGGCNAVGMSLEIGLEPAKTDAVVQAELWLVRPNGDGTERSERQVLRLPVGQPPSSYYFDEGRLVEPLSKQTLAKVFGDLSAASVGADGKIHLNFKLARRYEPVPRGTDSTARVETSYRDLLATPGEVLAFQLPTMEIPIMRITNVTGGQQTTTPLGMKPLPQLSVRLRTELVK